jgi:SRSO17 transposase
LHWSIGNWRTARAKPEIALAEIVSCDAAGVRFGCVLADAGYGLDSGAQEMIYAVFVVETVGFNSALLLGVG